MLIDVRCQHCHKLLLQMTKDSTGVVRIKCRHCDKMNDVALATVIKIVESKSYLDQQLRGEIDAAAKKLAAGESITMTMPEYTRERVYGLFGRDVPKDD